MDNDLIVVEVHDFPRITSCQDDVLRKKAEWLRNTFECFKTDAIPQWKRKGSIPKPLPVQRQKIGNKELSCEAIARKDVMSLMNKLTATNKDHIFAQLKSSLRENYADIYVKCIWDFMLLCPEHQNTYSDILLQLSCYIDVHTTIQYIWDQYIQNTSWVPLTSNDIHNIDNYDIFCDHVKWKKQAIAKVKAFMIFCKRLLLPNSCQNVLAQHLFDTCKTLLQEDNYKVAEMIIEQITALIQSYNATNDGVQNTVTGWKNVATNFPPSLRFKIYDLHDLIQRKNDNKK